MNKKAIFWLAVLALSAAPAVNSMAQEEQGPGPGSDEVEAQGEAPGHPGMAPGMEQKGQPGRGMKAGMDEGMRGGMGQGMRPGMGKGEFGGPVFIEEAAALATIKKNDAAFGKKLEDLKDIAPAKYKMIMQMSGKMLGMAKMEKDAGMEQDIVRGLSLEFETKELALQYNKASDAEKAAIKVKLTPLLSELFDLKTKAQEQRVKHMDGEIARLKKNLESRKANKTKIVEQRLGQLTGEETGW